MSHAEPCMCAACSLCARIAIPCNCKQLAVRHTGLSSDGRWHVSVLIVCQTRKLAVTYDATLTSPLTWQDRWANDAYRKQVSNYRWVIDRVCVISACTDSGSSAQRHCPRLNWQAAIYVVLVEYRTTKLPTHVGKLSRKIDRTHNRKKLCTEDILISAAAS